MIIIEGKRYFPIIHNWNSSISLSNFLCYPRMLATSTGGTNPIFFQPHFSGKSGLICNEYTGGIGKSDVNFFWDSTGKFVGLQNNEAFFFPKFLLDLIDPNHSVVTMNDGYFLYSNRCNRTRRLNSEESFDLGETTMHPYIGSYNLGIHLDRVSYEYGGIEYDLSSELFAIGELKHKYGVRSGRDYETYAISQVMIIGCTPEIEVMGIIPLEQHTYDTSWLGTRIGTNPYNNNFIYYDNSGVKSLGQFVISGTKYKLYSVHTSIVKAYAPADMITAHKANDEIRVFNPIAMCKHLSNVNGKIFTLYHATSINRIDS